MDCVCKARCVEIDCKRQRRMLWKLRGGTAKLRIETGRWCGLKRDEQICKMCDEGEVEDVEHFVLHCICRLGGGEKGDGEVDERDCGGVARDGTQTLTRPHSCATCIWLLHPAPTSAQDGLDPLQLALVVFFLPSSSAKTSLALAVGIICNLRWWCFSCAN